MFDIGWSELLVIIVVAIVVVGPKELPRLMGTFGRYAGKLRRAAADFQRQFDEAMSDTEVAEVKKAMESVRAEADSLDQPVMLAKIDTPTPASATSSTTPPAATPPAPAVSVAPSVNEAKPKPKPPRKRAASTKPKSPSPKRKKKPAEPPHDG
jgi:sec-independent protein translocase protein TatB